MSWSHLSDEELLALVDSEGIGLTDWEIEFVADLVDHFSIQDLSEAQREKLEEIAEGRLHV